MLYFPNDRVSVLGFFGFIAGAVAAAVGIYGDEMYDKHE